MCAGVLGVCVVARALYRIHRRKVRRKLHTPTYRMAVAGKLDDDGTDDVLPPGIAAAVRASTAGVRAASKYSATRYIA